MNLRLASILSFCALALTLIIGLSVSTNQSVAAPLGTDQIVYFPYISMPPDLSIANLEISQGIQDVNNGVPLVANRPAVVRVYTETRSGNNVPSSSITLTATRGGTPLTPVTSNTMTASAASSRANLGSTFNITLPADWLSGTVQMRVQIDGQNGGGVVQTITFNTVPTLNVVLVPINYTHTGPGGGFYPGPTTDRISDWIMRAFPVGSMNVTIRAPYPFTGNLRNGDYWVNYSDGLLDRMSQLKFSESAPSSTIYYALVDFDCGWFDCNNGGIAGVGWIGARESVGLDFSSMDATGELAGHEIGHNFSRGHAPCNVSGDPNYPYAGASIGQYGLDGIGGSLQLLSPSGYVDMMSYCDPVWVSDYTYKALYADQVSNGAYIWAPTQESLLIQGSVAEDGSVALSPVYILPQTAVSPQNNLYQVELLDNAGNIIATHPIALLIAEEEGINARAVQGIVPMPDEPVAALRIVEVASQTAVASRTLSTASMAVSASLAQSSDLATVSWGVADVPANVRYTANDGQTWTAVGLNVLGGSLEVDLSGLPGGGNGRFEIILADQGSPTRFDVDLATPLSDKQPTVWITGSDSVAAGSPTILYAFGSDAEDGALGDFTWSVDGEVVTAPTSSLFLNELSVGEHIITLTATTSSGQIATTSIVVTVTP